jgi:hypothetical protein
VDLTSRYVAGDSAEEPVPTALLPADFCAYDRKVLAAAGGIDRGFGSADAAVEELSVRLWRMGFRCCIVPQVEVWGEDERGEEPGEAAEGLYDRMRIAALHLDAGRLRAFTDSVRGLPAYQAAAARLAASDVEQRRAAIAAVCAFPVGRYFESFAG